jgi:hypothetical protein
LFNLILTASVILFMKPVLRTVYLLLLFSIFYSPVSTLAEDAYKWKDSDGKTVYGSKPPSNARDVQRFGTREISRYSSTRVIERAESMVDNPEETSEAIETGEVFKDRKSSLPPRSSKTRSIVSAQSSELKPLVPQVRFNQLNEIVSCEVEVLNEGDMSVRDVSVAFEFFDGTLIPGAGPFVISPGSSEKYVIPEALLPLFFSVGDLPEGGEDVPAPAVIVHGSLY